MPPDVTVFAAQHLTYVDALLGPAVIVALLWNRHHAAQLCWFITSVLMVALTFAFSRFGSSLYDDPRPFVLRHFTPLLPHTANNGFPPGHAVLAATIVSAVLFLSRRWAIPFVLLALLVDWARVGVGLVHVIDIAGAWSFVVLATIAAWLVGPTLTAILLRRLPRVWSSGRFTLSASAARARAGVQHQ